MDAQRLPARLLLILLLLQAGVYYAVAYRAEKIPSNAPLKSFPQASGDWVAVQEFPLQPEVQEVLRADDTLNRIYVNRKRAMEAALFVAFFKTQRYGQSPHSPKNCLPGSGWQAETDQRIPLTVPGRSKPIVVNEYVISRGDDRSVVLYWYQSHNRIIARELEAKFWLVADAVRYHRSDTALVRIIAPERDMDRNAAEAAAITFAQAIYPSLVAGLPQ